MKSALVNIVNPGVIGVGWVAPEWWGWFIQECIHEMEHVFL